MNIELIRSKRKTIAIEINSDAKVVVRAPIGVPVSEINKFVGEKADWIDAHVRKMQQRKQEAEKSQAKELSKQEIKYLVTKAKRVIPQRVNYYAEKMGLSYGRITIRLQKSRWGSCSGKGNLNFNCLLVKAPEEVMDYVVVHELCHLKEMNHSPRFWSEVEKVLPDYRERRKWLKDHGRELSKSPETP